VLQLVATTFFVLVMVGFGVIGAFVWRDLLTGRARHTRPATKLDR
jgi:hypothetical protein